MRSRGVAVLEAGREVLLVGHAIQEGSRKGLVVVGRTLRRPATCQKTGGMAQQGREGGAGGGCGFIRQLCYSDGTCAAPEAHGVRCQDSSAGA